jgi:hypothetical protein
MRASLGSLCSLLLTTALACNRAPLTGAGGASAGATGQAGGTGAAGATGQAGAGDADAGSPPTMTCTSTTDEDNCGACGVRCPPTSTCVAGICGPRVVNVVPASPGCRSMDIAVSGGTVYWTDAERGAVFSRPIAGGATTTLANLQERPSHAAVAGGVVFWLAGTSTIRRMTNDVPVDIVSTPAPIDGFTLSPDGTEVFFSSGTTVSRVPASGGTPTVAVQEGEGEMPGAPAFMGPDRIGFLTAPGGNVDLAGIVAGQITSCGSNSVNQPFQNPCARAVYAQPHELVPDTVASTSGKLLFLDGTWVRAAYINASPPFPMFGVDNVATGDNVLTGVAATGSTVYFSDAGVIYKSLIVPQGTPIRIARNQNGARSLAVDATRVYWSTSGCTIESTNL